MTIKKNLDVTMLQSVYLKPCYYIYSRRHQNWSSQSGLWRNDVSTMKEETLRSLELKLAKEVKDCVEHVITKTAKETLFRLLKVVLHALQKTSWRRR